MGQLRSPIQQLLTCGLDGSRVPSAHRSPWAESTCDLLLPPFSRV